eukprot:TRINITY_DN1793_c0_g1_i1.p1 TRINITY_DN1793_c0_g1~~TRINITY_DN1793_c0_g1_i1.p1  ORF type:complete len:363 (+),score=34.02 TRINITY_DN1793_c0_g1_i1:137-1225(+)
MAVSNLCLLIVAMALTLSLAVPAPGQVPEGELETERRSSRRRRRRRSVPSLRAKFDALEASFGILQTNYDILQANYTTIHTRFDALNAAVVDGVLRGPPGSDGPPGPTGPSGNDGAQGPAGPAGPAGSDGNDGAPGENGSEGVPGKDGLDGAQGAAGATGPAGVTGGQGPAGVDGAEGAQGPAGATGPQGPAGIPATQTPTGAPTPVPGVLGCTTWKQVADTSDPILRGGSNALIPTDLVQSPLGLYRFSNPIGTKVLYIKDLNAVFGGSFNPWIWHSDDPSAIQCAVNDETTWRPALGPVAETVQCDSKAVGSHRCGVSSGWILWHDGATYQAPGQTNPCAVPGADVVGHSDLYVLEACQA